MKPSLRAFAKQSLKTKLQSKASQQSCKAGRQGKAARQSVRAKLQSKAAKPQRKAVKQRYRASCNANNSQGKSCKAARQGKSCKAKRQGKAAKLNKRRSRAKLQASLIRRVEVEEPAPSPGGLDDRVDTLQTARLQSTSCSRQLSTRQ